MKSLNNKILKILEDNGFSVDIDNVTKQIDNFYIELNQSTPAGEDWWFTIMFDGTDEGFINEFESYYNSFDVDEEAEVWIESRGKNGVPSSIKTIVEDQEWKEEKLLDTLNDLQKIDLD